jgi:hypothetical protein
MASEQSALLLRKQLRGIPHVIVGLIVKLVDLTKNPVEGFSAGLVDDSNVYEVLYIFCWPLIVGLIVGNNDNRTTRNPLVTIMR